MVKTTPKPRATKKSSGELVGPLLLPFDPELGEEDGLDAEGGSDAVDMVALEELYSSICRWFWEETQPFAEVSRSGTVPASLAGRAGCDSV